MASGQKPDETFILRPRRCPVPQFAFNTRFFAAGAGAISRVGLIEYDLVLAVADRVQVGHDEDRATNNDRADSSDVERHRLGSEGVARRLLEGLKGDLLLLEPAG